MKNLIRQSDLPVLMLSNGDQRWSMDEICESISLTNNLVSALQALGHPVSSICVEIYNLPDLLRKYYPDELIVFNMESWGAC
jgi:hypothetical protein